jgi:hypothetical protein
MTCARLIGFILAAMLLVNSFLGAPAIAQLDEAAALTNVFAQPRSETAIAGQSALMTCLPGDRIQIMTVRAASQVNLECVC